MLTSGAAHHGRRAVNIRLKLLGCRILLGATASSKDHYPGRFPLYVVPNLEILCIDPTSAVVRLSRPLEVPRFRISRSCHPPNGLIRRQRWLPTPGTFETPNFSSRRGPGQIIKAQRHRKSGRNSTPPFCDLWGAAVTTTRPNLTNYIAVRQQPSLLRLPRRRHRTTAPSRSRGVFAVWPGLRSRLVN